MHLFLSPQLLSTSSQIIECLKENKKVLSQTCHQKIFKLQETEMVDPELDYQLMRVCKQMIKVRCSDGKPRCVHSLLAYFLVKLNISPRDVSSFCVMFFFRSFELLFTPDDPYQ